MRAIASGEAERNHIALKPGKTGDESMRADAHMLMHRARAADHHVIACLHMSAEQDIVRKHDMIADLAIVRDVGIGQKSAVIADLRSGAASGRPEIDGDALANNAMSADGQRSRFAERLQILRFIAERSERKNSRAGADAGFSAHHDMRREFDIGAKLDMGADMTIGTDDGAFAQNGAAFDDCRRMNAKAHAARLI